MEVLITVMSDKEKITSLIKEIKKKKELQSIDDNFVAEHIHKFLQHELKTAQALKENFNPKSKAYASVIKKVRFQLRKVYGLFRDDQKERKRVVEELLNQISRNLQDSSLEMNASERAEDFAIFDFRKSVSEKRRKSPPFGVGDSRFSGFSLSSPKEKRTSLIKQILSTHSSTQERLPSYQRLYTKIFSITGKPKAILDLGCGINPFSFPYMKLKGCTYYAYDINEEEIASINQYFKLLHTENSSFKGKAIVADIINTDLPKADLCFLLKMTDVIDQGKGHKRTEELLKRIPATFIVVSFATKTMSGKEMTAPRRSWMEWLCRRLGYEYTILEFPNELFYVVKRN